MNGALGRILYSLPTLPNLAPTSIQSISVKSADLAGKLPKDNDEVFEKIRADPLVDTADMRVEGNWTYRSIADFISAKEFAQGQEIDWEELKEVEWAKLSRMEKIPTFSIFGGPAGLEADFGSGDPALGVGVGDGYTMQGRADSASALVVDGNMVVAPERGERALAFNAPRNVDIAEMITRYGWSYQQSAVAAILKNLPTLGASGNWRVPAFSTAGPTLAFVPAYTFAYGAPMPGIQSVFDIKSSRGGTYSFAMRNKNGKEITSTDVDLSEGDNTVTIVWLNVPQSGMITIDSNGKRFTITNTEARPPIL